MEALYGVYSYVEDIKQDYVVMTDGDVACNIDLEAVFQSHLESGADITAVCTTNLSGDPKLSTYFKINDTGRIVDVLDSPHSPRGLRVAEGVHSLHQEAAGAAGLLRLSQSLFLHYGCSAGHEGQTEDSVLHL